MVPDSILDLLSKMLPKGKGSVYRISPITLRGYNRSRKASSPLTYSTLSDAEGRMVAKWLLDKIAASYATKLGFDEGWGDYNWVAFVLLGYWVGWANKGTGTLLRNLKSKGVPLTLGNALIESREANVRKAVRTAKNYVLMSRIAKAYAKDEGIALPKLVAIPKTAKTVKASSGLLWVAGAGLATLVLYAVSRGKD